MKHLNGSEVSATEREKAERHFVRYFLEKDDKPHHFDALRQKHSDVTPLVDIDIGFGFKEWAMLHFRLGGKIVLSHKVKVIEPIAKLRKFVSKKLLLDDRSFKMYHLPCGPHHVNHTPVGPELEELFLDSLPMSRFDFLDDDEILIDPVA